MLLVSVFIVSFSFGQISRDSLVKLFVKNVCDKFKAKKLEGRSTNIMMHEFGKITTDQIKIDSALIKSIFTKSELENTSDTESFAYKYSTELMKICPEYLSILQSSSESKEILNQIKKDSSNKNFSVEEAVSKIETKSYTIQESKGTILKIGFEEFSYIVIKNLKNKIEKFFWIDKFRGDEILSNKSRSLINRKVTVYYTTINRYNFTKNNKQKIKIITGIELVK